MAKRIKPKGVVVDAKLDAPDESSKTLYQLISKLEAEIKDLKNSNAMLRMRGCDKPCCNP